MQKIEIILRKEKNPYTKQYEPIIFFRDISHLKHTINVECFDGCHVEASIYYYLKCKPATIEESKELLNIFKGIYNDYEIIIKKKLKYN